MLAIKCGLILGSILDFLIQTMIPHPYSPAPSPLFSLLFMLLLSWTMERVCEGVVLLLDLCSAGVFFY